MINLLNQWCRLTWQNTPAKFLTAGGIVNAYGKDVASALGVIEPAATVLVVPPKLEAPQREIASAAPEGLLLLTRCKWTRA